jgi:hypothetical protein
MARNPSSVGARSSALLIPIIFFECIFFANDLGKKLSLKILDKKIDRNPHHPFEIILIFTRYLSVVEHSFGPLKDFAHFATRYDKFARNSFFAPNLIAIVVGSVLI